jgi:hypothetical protein
VAVAVAQAHVALGRYPQPQPSPLTLTFDQASLVGDAADAAGNSYNMRVPLDDDAEDDDDDDDDDGPLRQHLNPTLTSPES